MQEIKEEWRDIEEYYGLYQISNLGRIKSLNYRRTGKEKILKPVNTNDYFTIELCKEGNRKRHRVHRLVALHFIPNPNNYPMVNHRNEIKTDNQVGNLEWCDAKYNNNYGTRTERSAEKLSKQVLCIETGVIYPSTHQVERQLGFRQQYISQCCNGKYKQAYRLHWKYVN